MKKVLILAAGLMFSCNKKNMVPFDIHQQESSNVSNVYQEALKQKSDPKNKKANLDGGPNDPGCIEGDAYCQEVIVTPKFMDLLMKSISNNENVNDVINSNFDNEIGVSLIDKHMQSEIKHVRNGSKKMIYRVISGNRIVLLIGNKNHVSENNYDAAIVLE